MVAPQLSSTDDTKNDETPVAQPRTLSGTVVLVGAGGGIGAALLDKLCLNDEVLQVLALHPREVSSCDAKVVWVPLDLKDPASIASCATALAERAAVVDTLICASGYLHGTHGGPEKSLAELLAADLPHVMSINATGPLQLLSACLPLLKRATAPRVCFLSAQVGSIADNRLGGWYGYRMSKAALNMGVKTASIELERWRNEPTVVAVHPGTTLSELSRPFTKRRQVPPVSAGECADRLVDVLERVTAEDSGRFLNYQGADLPW